MRFLNFFFVFIIASSLKAQFPMENMGIMTFSNERSPQNLFKSSDTLGLPFIDGFNNGLRHEWISMGVVQAHNWSKDPLSTGSAVFDGISSDGQAYNPGVIVNDSITDVLISPYFNFQGLTNIVLSFYLQNGGWGDPTESQDSLIIHFWNPTDSSWIHGESYEGGGNQEKWIAKSVIFPSSLEGLNGVRFKFSRYGSPGGMFDHFLLDYLELGANRNVADTLLFDPTWSRKPGALTRIYSEVPWWHYNSLILERDSLPVAYRRNGSPPIGGWQLNLGKYLWHDDNSNLIASRNNVPVVTNLDHNISTPYQFSITKPGISMLGPTKWHFQGWFDGENVGERFNDTLKIVQNFDSRYGLDDGSAERSYGVTQGVKPKYAQKFDFMIADTIVGFDISFAAAGYDWSNMNFKIGIWEIDSLGLPGDEVYISKTDYSPVLPFTNSPFRHFMLDTTGIYAPKNVYIGIQQTTGPAITTGLDLSKNGEKAYGDENGWFPSLLPGTLLIRPILRNAPGDLSDQERSGFSQILLSPNPVKFEFKIKGCVQFEKFYAYSSLGKLTDVFSADQEGEVHQSTRLWPSGIYYLISNNGSRISLIVSND